MIMLRFEEIYKVRINYKSGISETHWFTDFKYSKDHSGAMTMKWAPAFTNARPVLLGVDDVESVWQVDYKKRLVW